MEHQKVRRVLVYRRHREEQLARQMRQQQDIYHHEEKQLAALQQTRQSYQERLETSVGAAMAHSEVQQWSHYYHTLGQYVETQKNVIQQVAEVATAKHRELLVACQERKMMEKLEGKALQQLRRQRARQEVRRVDDLALMRSQYSR